MGGARQEGSSCPRALAHEVALTLPKKSDGDKVPSGNHTHAKV